MQVKRLQRRQPTKADRSVSRDRQCINAGALSRQPTRWDAPAACRTPSGTMPTRPLSFPKRGRGGASQDLY